MIKRFKEHSRLLLMCQIQLAMEEQKGSRSTDTATGANLDTDAYIKANKEVQAALSPKETEILQKVVTYAKRDKLTRLF